MPQDEVYQVPTAADLARKNVNSTQALLAWAAILRSITLNPALWKDFLDATEEDVRRLLNMAVAYSQVEFTPGQNQIALNFYGALTIGQKE